MCVENVHVLYAVGENEFSKATFDLYFSFLEEVLHTIEKILPHGLTFCTQLYNYPDTDSVKV